MTTNLKRAISRITDIKELHELSNHIQARRKLLNERRWLAEVEEAWERIKVLPVGTTLHVATKGTFFGGPFQRGDVFTLKSVGRRTITVENKGRLWRFPAVQIKRYDLSTEPPESPMSAESRAQVERIAERIAA